MNSNWKKKSTKKLQKTPQLFFFQYLGAPGLSCSMQDLVPWSGIKPSHPPRPPPPPPSKEQSVQLCISEPSRQKKRNDDFSYPGIQNLISVQHTSDGSHTSQEPKWLCPHWAGWRCLPGRNTAFGFSEAAAPSGVRTPSQRLLHPTVLLPQQQVEKQKSYLPFSFRNLVMNFLGGMTPTFFFWVAMLWKRSAKHVRRLSFFRGWLLYARTFSRNGRQK